MFLIQSLYFATFAKAAGISAGQPGLWPGRAMYEVIPTIVALPLTLLIKPPGKKLPIVYFPLGTKNFKKYHVIICILILPPLSP